MSELSDFIRDLRKGSAYRNLRAFSEQAGLSHEGLRKIENGERVPNSQTLERILSVGQVPKEVREKMRVLREREHAAKAGVSLPSLNISVELAGAALEVFEQFLAEFDEKLTTAEKRKLTNKLNKAIKARISA